MGKMWEYSQVDVETLGLIEKQRRSFGMSQSELARRAKVSRKTIMDIERGAVDPSLSRVLRILEQLGIALIPEYIGLPEDKS